MKLNIEREMLRLLCNTEKNCHQIAEITGKSWHTVKRYQQLLVALKLDWSQVNQMNDQKLKLTFKPGVTQGSRKAWEDWAYIHSLKQNEKHQTLRQLHYEHVLIYGDDALSYSQYTHHYREYVKSVDVSMRQTWLPGEVCFVDFAGRRIPWMDSETGEVHYAEIFVGVLGYSQLTFAMALPSQKIPDFLVGHIQMLSYFGGTPLSIVPDNLKSAVTKAGRFPTINRSYQELAEHYDVVIEPARVRRPKDKALGEIGVLLVTRWITVVLRRRKFFSVEEINQAIVPLLEHLNQRPFRRYEGCRLSRFTDGEADKLKALPAHDLVIGRWESDIRADKDHHVYVERHAYSVPYQYAKKIMDVKLTTDTVEIWHEGNIVAIHAKSDVIGGSTTDLEHRSFAHRKFAEQTLHKFEQWAEEIGEATLQFVRAQFDNKPVYSVSASRACIELKKLASRYGKHRFNNASQCALNIGSTTLTSVKSILESHIDEAEQNLPEQRKLPLHQNVRGADYYANGRAPS